MYYGWHKFFKNKKDFCLQVNETCNCNCNTIGNEHKMKKVTLHLDVNNSSNNKKQTNEKRKIDNANCKLSRNTITVRDDTNTSETKKEISKEVRLNSDAEVESKARPEIYEDTISSSPIFQNIVKETSITVAKKELETFLKLKPQGQRSETVNKRGEAGIVLEVAIPKQSESNPYPKLDVEFTRSRAKSVKDRDNLCREHISKLLSHEVEAQGDDFERFYTVLEETLANLHIDCDDNLYLAQLTSATCFIPTELHGSSEMIDSLRNVCNKYKHLFSTVLGKEPATVAPMVLEVDETLWKRRSNKGTPREQTLAKQKELDKQLDALLTLGIIEPSTAEYYSQVHMTPKPNQDPNVKAADLKWRFCLDYRNLNVATRTLGHGVIPNIQEMIQRLGKQKSVYFGKIDLTAGYHQAPMSKQSRPLTSFITHRGIFQWTRVPMGLKTAPSYF